MKIGKPKQPSKHLPPASRGDVLRPVTPSPPASATSPSRRSSWTGRCEPTTHRWSGARSSCTTAAPSSTSPARGPRTSSAGTSPRARAPRPPLFANALHLAVECNSLDVARLLLKYGTDPSEPGLAPSSVEQWRRGQLQLQQLPLPVLIFQVPYNHQQHHQQRRQQRQQEVRAFITPVPRSAAQDGLSHVRRQERLLRRTLHQGRALRPRTFIPGGRGGQRHHGPSTLEVRGVTPGAGWTWRHPAPPGHLPEQSVVVLRPPPAGEGCPDQRTQQPRGVPHQLLDSSDLGLMQKSLVEDAFSCFLAHPVSRVEGGRVLPEHGEQLQELLPAEALPGGQGHQPTVLQGQGGRGDVPPGLPATQQPGEQLAHRGRRLGDVRLHGSKTLQQYKVKRENENTISLISENKIGHLVSWTPAKL
ncbi:ANK_REP_REGION domain-containing protein [Caerostris extrusa]|uniref:ANK_REP_REGION domain-containing protein n=1 Tax=Caerostris extrusa TaxID=172846 RepID=A0AAV4TMG1_CAEEX|nr:ANK_REP_REGION domain-containing protein [Caerostris extrusa]